jgi:hypothetical protein
LQLEQLGFVLLVSKFVLRFMALTLLFFLSWLRDLLGVYVSSWILLMDAASSDSRIGFRAPCHDSCPVPPVRCRFTVTGAVGLNTNPPLVVAVVLLLVPLALLSTGFVSIV